MWIAITAHQRVDLRYGRVVDAQTLVGDPVQRRVVEHDDRVGVEREPLQREQRVVRLHDHVAYIQAKVPTA